MIPRNPLFASLYPRIRLIQCWKTKNKHWGQSKSSILCYFCSAPNVAKVGWCPHNHMQLDIWTSRKGRLQLMKVYKEYCHHHNQLSRNSKMIMKKVDKNSTSRGRQSRSDKNDSCSMREGVATTHKKRHLLCEREEVPTTVVNEPQIYNPKLNCKCSLPYWTTLTTTCVFFHLIATCDCHLSIMTHNVV